jgi:hypothetical protein
MTFGRTHLICMSLALSLLGACSTEDDGPEDSTNSMNPSTGQPSDEGNGNSNGGGNSNGNGNGQTGSDSDSGSGNSGSGQNGSGSNGSNGSTDQPGNGGGSDSPGGGDSIPTFPPCEGGSTEPCGTYKLPTGGELPLGPYGAQMDVNVGQGFENAVASGDSSPTTCRLFAASFGEDQESTDRLLDTGDLNFALYTVYRPAHWVEGEKYPIITWGNGTCAQPEGYGALLRYVASYGYFVVAANSRWVGSGAAQRKALDFAFAANDDPESPYYQKLDTDKVGAMGHSQGGQGTAQAAKDARIKTAILFNGGTAADKPFMAVSGDYDIGGQSVSSYSSAVLRAPKAAYLWYHMVPMTGSASGHLTLMTQPERVAGPTVAWMDFLLRNDAEAREWFVGSDCKLCNNKAEFEFGQKGLD